MKKQNGYLALLAVLMILIMGALGTTLTYSYFANARGTLNFNQAEQALLIASSGAEKAARYVLQKSIACASITNHSDLTNTSFGNGTFTVTGTSTIATNSLNGAIAANDTSLTLNSSSGFASSGVVKIDSEIMSYQSISGNTLNGLARGLFTTTAASHASGASASQSQCALDSRGGIPNLTSPLFQSKIKKVLPQYTSTGFGFAVGATSGGKYTIAYYNGTTWSSQSTISGTADLKSVEIASGSSAFAYGAAGSSLTWNGSSWTSAILSPATDMYGISCGSNNDCHTVGDNQGSFPTIYDYDGTLSKNNNSISGTSKKTNLKAIDCINANYCWAVGDENQNGKIFYQWQGTSSGWWGFTNSLSSYPYYGVACNTDGTCWAVGTGSTFAYYNGSSWSNISTSLPNVQYNSVSCAANNFCVAVGNISSGKDTIAIWNGTNWSLNTNYPTPVANLYGVSCTDINSCWAVGGSSSGNNPTFVQWNGSNWQNVTVAGMPSAAPLYGVSLASGNISSIPSNSALTYTIYP